MVRNTVIAFEPRLISLSYLSAVKDTVLPLSKPVIGLNGQQIHEISVPAGTTVFASLLVPNTSVQIWGEDALEFRPERWLSPLPHTVVNSSLPGIYSHMYVLYIR